jgi:hypothetical protein
MRRPAEALSRFVPREQDDADAATGAMSSRRHVKLRIGAANCLG